MRWHALSQLRRMLHLDRQHTGPDLDGVDLAKGDGKDGQQIRIVGKLGHPDPAEALVAQCGEVLHDGIDGRTAIRVAE